MRLIVVCHSIDVVAQAKQLEAVQKVVPNLSDKAGEFNEGIRTLGSIRDWLRGRMDAAWSKPVVLFHPADKVAALREEIGQSRRTMDAEPVFISVDDLSELPARVGDAVSLLSQSEEVLVDA